MDDATSMLATTFCSSQNRRSYLVPTHLVPTHLVPTLCYLSLIFTHNLLQIRKTSLHTFEENNYLENDIGLIRSKPIV